MKVPALGLLLFLLLPGPAAARGAPASLSGITTQYFRALLAGDSKAFLKQTITASELKVLTGQPVDPKAHEAALKAFIDQRIAELKEASEAGELELKRVEIIDVLVLGPDSSRLKKVVPMAVVRPILETPASERGGFPHYLFQVGSTWKLALKP